MHLLQTGAPIESGRRSGNDEFRDGNVSAGKDIKRIVDEAVDMLPQGNWRINIRSDSAAYDMDTLDYWDGKHWGFAVSADMHTQVREEVEKLPEQPGDYGKLKKKG